jgi:hypothetical protein
VQRQRCTPCQQNEPSAKEEAACHAEYGMEGRD